MTSKLEKWIECNEKRTGGEGDVVEIEEYDEYGYPLRCCYEVLGEIFYREENAQFIAQSTKILPEIKALQAENAKYEDLIIRLLPVVEDAVNDPCYKQESIKKLLKEVQEVARAE